MHHIKSLFSATLLLAVLSLATPASAFDNQITTGIGQFNIKDSEPAMTTSVKPVGFYVGWAGIFNPYIAVEARLGGTGTGTNSLISLDAAFLSALFKPTLPIGDRFELYGLVGVSSVGITRQLPGLPAETASRSGFSYGLGGDARVTPHVLIGAEWVSYISDTNFGAAGNTVNLSLSGATATFKYQF